MNERIIKFRAWHKPTKRMFQVFTLGDDVVFEDSMDGVGTSPTLPAERSDCDVMQYIGSRDKKGKMIYDGDILNVGENSFVKMKVVWNERELQWAKMYLDIPNYKMSFLENEQPYLEVIGNIYESPELIAPKK